MEDAWQDDLGWGVAAPPAPAPYDLYEGPSDGWQQASAPFPQVEAWADIPHGMAGMAGMAGPPARRAQARAHSAVTTVSRLTLNTTMFGLVLLILLIAIVVGLHYVQSAQSPSAQSDQPTPTVVPTAVPPDGFAGLQANLYSVSYPTVWSHTSVGDTLGCLCAVSGEMFGDGVNTSLVIYTRPAAPADELANVLAKAAASVVAQQTPRATLLNQQKTYGGARWQENDYTITKVVGTNTVQLQVRVLVVNANATTYIVVASAPQSSFSHVNSVYFEPMLRSFRFNL